jgi:hypothetical protein
MLHHLWKIKCKATLMWVAIITLFFSQNLINYCREETTTPQNEKWWYVLEFMIHQLLNYK